MSQLLTVQRLFHAYLLHSFSRTQLSSILVKLSEAAIRMKILRNSQYKTAYDRGSASNRYKAFMLIVSSATDFELFLTLARSLATWLDTDAHAKSTYTVCFLSYIQGLVLWTVLFSLCLFIHRLVASNSSYLLAAGFPPETKRNRLSHLVFTLPMFSNGFKVFLLDKLQTGLEPVIVARNQPPHTPLLLLQT